MSEWLKNLVGYMLIVSVSMQMLPSRKYDQYIKLFTGFLLIIFVLHPFLKIGSADVYLENKISEFVQEQERLEKQIGKDTEDYFKQNVEYEKKESLSVEIHEIQEVVIGD